MKKIIPFFLIEIFFFMAGFAQSPLWKENGEAISARADLDVRWEASNKFPRKVWIYQLLPNKFSPEVISNVMMLCSFTEKNKVQQVTNGVTFKSSDGSRTLSISYPSSNIHYEIPELNYSPTNLAIGVPLISQLPPMATNVLHKLHIRFSDITGYSGTNKIEYLEPVFTEYYIGNTSITNIAYRSVLFRRVVDEMPIIGEFYGFNVGEHGKISRLSITWPKLKRIKSYRTLSQREVINLLRKGDAIRGPVPTRVGDIDWSRIKSLTIKMAMPSYQMKGNRLYPFLRLDVLVDTGNGTVEIGMDCPIIDETK